MHGTPLMTSWNKMNCCHSHQANVRVPTDVWGYTKMWNIWVRNYN